MIYNDLFDYRIEFKTKSYLIANIYSIELLLFKTNDLLGVGHNKLTLNNSNNFLTL